MAQSRWRRLAKAAVRLYPRAWRARYADELRALLDGLPSSPGVTADVIAGALRERGVYRAVSRAAGAIWTVVRAWVLALVSIAALWILFVLVLATLFSDWYGFDPRAWTIERMGNLRSVVIPSTSFYFLPSLLFSLPVLVVLLLLRGGRRRWLARVAYVGAFLFFSVWWDGTLIVDQFPADARYEHIGMLIAGWLIAVRLFPRKADASPAASAADGPATAGNAPSSPQKQPPWRSWRAMEGCSSWRTTDA